MSILVALDYLTLRERRNGKWGIRVDSETLDHTFLEPRDAWNSVKGTTTEEAYTKYVDKLEEVGYFQLYIPHKILSRDLPFSDPQRS